MSSAAVNLATGGMRDMDNRCRTHVAEYYVTSLLILRIHWRYIYQTVEASCDGILKILKILWAALGFNSLLHRTNPPQEAGAAATAATINTVSTLVMVAVFLLVFPLFQFLLQEINWLAIVATASSSNTSTPVAQQNEHEWVPIPEPNDQWLLDSGASCCATGNASLLEGLHTADKVEVDTANGQKMISTSCGRAFRGVKLSGIRLFKEASANLISLGFLVQQGCHFTFNIHGVEIWKGNVRIGWGRLLANNTWSVDSLDDTLLEAPECNGCPSQHRMLID